MPPRANNNGFRGTGAFKPPRPSGQPESDEPSSASKRKRIEISDDDVAEDTEAVTDNDDKEERKEERKPALPPALLARLLSHFFENPKGTPTRLTQDAHATVDKYMEIFIREAVARCVVERTGEPFLDVDILQKVASQLIMDM